MPFIYMRNSKRPTMNPCGTHHVIFEGGFFNIQLNLLNNTFKPCQKPKLLKRIS